MNPFLYINMITFGWVLFLILYLPGSAFYEAYQKEKWLFLYVGAITILPVMLMIYFAAWWSKRRIKQ